MESVPEENLQWNESVVVTDCSLNIICKCYRIVGPYEDITWALPGIWEGQCSWGPLGGGPRQHDRKSASPSLSSPTSGRRITERESTETKNFKCLCVGLLGLPNKEPQTGKLNRNMLSYNSGSWKSETKVSMGLVPSKGGEGETVLGISPQFIDGPLLCVPSFRLPSICVCLCAKLFHKDTSRITLGPTRMTSS